MTNEFRKELLEKIESIQKAVNQGYGSVVDEVAQVVSAQVLPFLAEARDRLSGTGVQVNLSAQPIEAEEGEAAGVVLTATVGDDEFKLETWVDLEEPDAPGEPYPVVYMRRTGADEEDVYNPDRDDITIAKAQAVIREFVETVVAAQSRRKAVGEAVERFQRNLRNFDR